MFSRKAHSNNDENFNKHIAGLQDDLQESSEAADEDFEDDSVIKSDDEVFMKSYSDVKTAL